MTSPRAMVLRAAGINCDRETVAALEMAGAEVQLTHVRALADGGQDLRGFQIIVIPGGFSYGDHIAAGRVLAVELNTSLRDAVDRHLDGGGVVLGICNGFQVLVQMGLLPGDGARGVLAGNDSRRFECCWVHLEVQGQSGSPFFETPQRLYLPVAHAEGKWLSNGDLDVSRRVLLRYVDAFGRPGDYPINPNGAQDHIAGLTDASGRILGLMPHPERHVRSWQHPAHTADIGRAARPDGLGLFRRMVSYFR